MNVDEFIARLKANPPSDESCSEASSTDSANHDSRLAREIRYKAISLLARREHSFQELESKLRRLFSDEALILQQLQALADEGLQSDQRYAEISIRSALAKFHGFSRIKNQLVGAGISSAVIETALSEFDVDWQQQLKELSLRKYGDMPCDDIKEKAKRIRFFQYRGYSLSDIYLLMDES